MYAPNSVPIFTTTTRMLAAFPTGAVTPLVVQTLGRTAAGLGGADFRYVSTDVTSADNSGTIRVDGASRRWYALLGDDTFYSALFGVTGDGTTDDKLALQAMFNAAEAKAGSNYGPVPMALTPTPSASLIRCSFTIQFNPQRATLDGRGQTLDFTEVNGAGAFTALKIATETDSHTSQGASQLASRVSLKNISIYMPSYLDTPNGVGLEITSDEFDGWNACFVIQNVAITGGGTGLRFGAGSWGGVIDGLFIINASGQALYRCIDFLSTYQGERVTIRHGLMGNIAGPYAIEAAYGGNNLILTEMHLDGCRGITKISASSTHQFSDCYFEFTQGIDATWFELVDNDSVVVLENCVISPRTDLVFYRLNPMFLNAGTVVLNGVTFVASGFQGYEANGGFLSSGVGAVHLVPNSVIYGAGYAWGPLPDKKSAFNAFPDCNSADTLDNFTVSNTGAGDDPIRVAGVTHGVTRDCIRLKINNPGVPNDDSVLTFPVTQLDRVDGGRRMSYVCDAAGVLPTNVVFAGRATFKDATGNILLLQNVKMIDEGAGNANWGVQAIGMDLGYVPQGAVTLEFFVRLIVEIDSSVAVATLDVSPFGLGFCT